MLRLEVVVDRALRDAEGVGDHLQRRGVDAITLRTGRRRHRRCASPSTPLPGLATCVMARTLADRLTAPSRAASVRRPHDVEGAHMPSARDAKEWAATGGLHGIGDSLYTPFSGTDGDDIDYDAYRALVRYCVGDLGHSMLWLTSGIAEWWSLTMDERKQLVEFAIEEARAIAARHRDPGVHERDVGQGLRRAHAARRGRGRRHLLPADAADGGARRRGRAALLPVRRRPHRHRARHVQLAVVGLRAHARGLGR